MRKKISLMTLFLFVFTQTAAYAQMVGTMPSGPAPQAATQVAPEPAQARPVVPVVSMPVERVSVEDSYDAEKEQAMLEALSEAARMGNEKRHVMTGDSRLSGDGLLSGQKRKILVNGKVPPAQDFIGSAVNDVNEKIYPVKISGDYRASWGYDAGDNDSEGHRGIWKSADFNKANMVYIYDNQYIFGPDRHNTYDKRIYDRFRMKIETVRETGFNILTETVVDPWSFVGTTDALVINGSDGSQLPLKLRYWSNTQSTIGQRTVLSNGTDFVNIPEIKVHDGHTEPMSIYSRWANARFDIPPTEIERDFRPMRKLEVNYTSDLIKFKVFPLADHDHAFTSDDPLILSNQHIYWEPSPWLWRWEPGMYYGPTNDFMKGRWSDEIAFQSRDSDFTFLTLLRGLSFDVTWEDTYLGAATAAPLDLWQEYGDFNSLPGAIRFKQGLFEDYYVGGVYTYNYGFDDGHVDAYNHVYGFDAGYEIPDFFKLRGELAWSVDKIDAHGNDPNISDSDARGSAVRIESQGQFLRDSGGTPQLKVSTSFTHMGDDFKPRLSNYTNTAMDQFWGKHISFQAVDPDFDAFKIGTGVDTGRNVFNIRIENMLFRERLGSLFDMRFVRGDEGRKVEDVYREELTAKFLENLTGKFLFRYQDLPETIHDRDPYILPDYISSHKTGRYIFNNDIQSGENADVWTYSLGLHHDPFKWLGLEGIWERTNDHEIFPSRVLNDAGFLDLGSTREFLYFLYGQPLIAAPPYDAYDIYKARLYWTPIETVRTKLEYVVNEFKHAPGWDDNISHWGIEVDVDFTKQLTGSFKFIRSQVVDLFRQQQLQEDLPYENHNNIFASLSYAINNNTSFVVEFGEFFIPTEYSPVAWMLSTLDTQRIVRLYLKGKF